MTLKRTSARSGYKVRLDFLNRWKIKEKASPKKISMHLWQLFTFTNVYVVEWHNRSCYFNLPSLGFPLALRKLTGTNMWHVWTSYPSCIMYIHVQCKYMQAANDNRLRTHERTDNGLHLISSQFHRSTTRPIHEPRMHNTCNHVCIDAYIHYTWPLYI